MKKITCDYLEENFSIGSDGLYYNDKIVVKPNTNYTNFTLYFRETVLNKTKIAKTKFVDVLDAVIFKYNFQLENIKTFGEYKTGLFFEESSEIPEEFLNKQVEPNLMSFLNSKRDNLKPNN